MKYLISFILVLLSFQSFAADDGDWWLQREIQLQQNREDYARRVYGSARHTYDTVDPVTSKSKTITKTVVVEDVPSKARLGKGLLQRANAFKGGIAGVLGGAAVTALIEAVGWVMDDGTFVKQKVLDDDPDLPDAEFYWLSVYNPQTKSRTYAEAASKMVARTCELNNYFSCSSPYNFAVQEADEYGPKKYGFSYDTFTSSGNKTVRSNFTTRYTNPKYDPNKEPTTIKIPITDEDVGGIVSGDYKDPVDSQYDITDKKYRSVVADAYQHDPTGIGNDLANEMDEKIKSAPPTPDGKPAPIGDPRYSQPPEEDQSTNDRSWGDDANEADGDTTPNTDPVTGEPTGGQSISLQFPVFCEWAHTMCKWYDDWKASDTVYKDHMKKTEEHQTEEKTFWGRVTGFFDWAKEEPEPDEEQEEPDIDDQGIFNKTFDTAFSLSKECPADIPFSYQTKYISGEFIFSLKWLCIIFTFLGYPLVFASHCVGVWILYEAVTRKQINWR